MIVGRGSTYGYLRGRVTGLLADSGQSAGREGPACPWFLPRGAAIAPGVDSSLKSEVREAGVG